MTQSRYKLVMPHLRSLGFISGTMQHRCRTYGAGEKRWRTTALQDAGALTGSPRMTRSVLECASPLALCSVSARGKDLRATQTAAYAAVECIQFEGAHFRRDIAAKAF
jgi:hypothetical protein